MTAIVTTVTTTTTEDTLVTEAAEGKVQFHTQRSNGTFRRIQFLAQGTPEREVAEWVAAQREDGVTMKTIAAAMHVSVPTVRRMINALLVTLEAEEDTAEVVAQAAFVVEAAEAITAEAAAAL